MKKIFIAVVLGLVTLATSCKVNYATNQVRYMPIKFDTLSRQDYTTVGDLKAEASVKYKKNRLDSKDPMVKNYKQGSLNAVAQPVLYNSQKQLGLIASIKALFGGGARTATYKSVDPGYDAAMFALQEKYPNIDYFVNVRVYRNFSGSQKTVKSYNFMTGMFETKKITVKNGPETVTIYATGIELKTDK